MLDVENEIFSVCAPKSIQNTNILITLGNTIPENKGLECTNCNNNIESRFPNQGFSINFAIS